MERYRKRRVKPKPDPFPGVDIDAIHGKIRKRKLAYGLLGPEEFAKTLSVQELLQLAYVHGRMPTEG